MMATASDVPASSSVRTRDGLDRRATRKPRISATARQPKRCGMPSKEKPEARSRWSRTRRTAREKAEARETPSNRGSPSLLWLRDFADFLEEPATFSPDQRERELDGPVLRLPLPVGPARDRLDSPGLRGRVGPFEKAEPNGGAKPERVLEQEQDLVAAVIAIIDVQSRRREIGLPLGAHELFEKSRFLVLENG